MGLYDGIVACGVLCRSIAIATMPFSIVYFLSSIFFFLFALCWCAPLPRPVFWACVIVPFFTSFLSSYFPFFLLLLASSLFPAAAAPFLIFFSLWMMRYVAVKEAWAAATTAGLPKTASPPPPSPPP